MVLNMIELFNVLKRDTARNLIWLIDISTENAKINLRRTGFKEKKTEKNFVSIRTHTHARTRTRVRARVRACLCEPVYDQNQQNQVDSQSGHPPSSVPMF